MHFNHDPYARRRRTPRAGVVPRQLAEEIARERDLYRARLGEVVQENDALREIVSKTRKLASADREDTHAALRAENEALKDEVARLRAEHARQLAQREEEQAARSLDEAEDAALDREHARAVARATELLGDLERLRRRQGEEGDRRAREATRAVLSDFLEIRDNLSRAIDAAREHGSGWADGMEALVAQFDAILEKQGVEVFGARGDDFDPRVHEALGAMRVEDLKSDQIAYVEREGYRFKDGELLRAAAVVVSR